MGFADLHIHSIYSYDGICTIPAILKYVSDQTDLNVIAITDHDTMQGIPEALSLAPQYGIEVIPGCEISTSDGHLLALFIDQPVPAGLSLVETIHKVGRMGGICIAAHPMAWGTSSLKFETISKALSDPEVAKILVGIEAFNGGLVDTSQNDLVREVSKMMPLAQVGNSDAHTLSVIGSGLTTFKGRTAADLKLALKEAITEPRQGKAMTGVKVLADYFPRYMLRLLGWAVWNSSPYFPLTYKRLSKIRKEDERGRISRILPSSKGPISPF